MTTEIHTPDHEHLVALAGWRLDAKNPAGIAGCSLIVPTYNRPLEAQEQIENLCRLPDFPAEVLFIDSSPDDATEKAVLAASKKQELPFDLIYVKSPKGLTLQRNVGVDISTKDVLFFLDDDAFPRPGYFQVIREALATVDAQPIGAVGACIINEINKPIAGRWRFRRALHLIPRSEPYLYNHVASSAPSGLLKPFLGLKEVDIFQGGACAIRRQVFEQERFSEFFQGYAYGEDVEMSMRIRRRWRVVMCGEAHIFHRGTSSTVGGRPDGFIRGKMEVINRHFIWNRYSSQSSFLNRVRLYLDFMLIFTMDLAWFCAKPTRLNSIRHAFGVAAGVLETLISPTKYQEPPVARRYKLALNSAAGK